MLPLLMYIAHCFKKVSWPQSNTLTTLSLHILSTADRRFVLASYI